MVTATNQVQRAQVVRSPCSDMHSEIAAAVSVAAVSWWQSLGRYIVVCQSTQGQFRIEAKETVWHQSPLPIMKSGRGTLSLPNTSIFSLALLRLPNVQEAAFSRFGQVRESVGTGIASTWTVQTTTVLRCRDFWLSESKYIVGGRREAGGLPLDACLAAIGKQAG